VILFFAGCGVEAGSLQEENWIEKFESQSSTKFGLL